VEVGVVGVVAGEVELELAARLPAVVGLGGEEVEAEDRVVHAQRGRVVAVVVLHVAVAARAHPVREHRNVRPVRVVDGLKDEVAVRLELETALGERVEDARRRVREVELAAVGHCPDAARLVRLRAFARNDRARRGRDLLDLRGRGGLLAFEFGDALGLRLDLGVLLLDEGLQRLQVGLRDGIGRRRFHGGDEPRAEAERDQCFLHDC